MTIRRRTRDGPARDPAGEAAPASPAGRLPRRRSLLWEVLAALVAVLLFSSLATGIFESRMTRSALLAQADQLAASSLAVVGSAYENQSQELAIRLREYAERLIVERSLEPGNRDGLEAALEVTRRLQSIYLLGIFEREGDFVAGTGSFLAGTEAVVGGGGSGTTTRLARKPDGRYLRIVSTELGEDHLLVGGLQFSDATALELRNALGNRGEVVLVVDGRVAASSIRLPGDEAPGMDLQSGSLPREPRGVDLNDRRMLIVYESLGGVGSLLEEAALGIALPDPVGDLTRDLALVRVWSDAILALAALGLGLLLFWRLIRPLVDLSRTASRIAGGDLEARFEATRDNEIGRLAHSLQRMTAELQGNTNRLQQASKRLLVAQHEERQRVARDLHDGLQQQLVGLTVKLKQAAATDGPPTRMTLERLAAQAEEASFDLQDLGRGIFPTVLGDQGVAAALRTSASRLPMPVRLQVAEELEDRRFRLETEGTLYFVALEAMTNAQKYASKSQVALRLGLVEEEVVLEVADDGPGFDVETNARTGRGLQNIADRVGAVGGTAEVVSGPGTGTIVRVHIPIEGDPGPGEGGPGP